MSAESSNLSNIEHRAVIKYFVKKGKTPKEIFEDMVSVLQESAPSYTMVKKWARSFQQERESCEDDPRPGRLVTIAEELQISKKRVGEIIHEHMNMRKISARWVPKMLTPSDKQRRLQTSKDFGRTTMNGQYYANLLAQARGSRTEATWEVIARVLFSQDNASVHTARVSWQALKDTGFSETTTLQPRSSSQRFFLFPI
ncbi:Putative uncharacterized protein FLJ37770 [Eumeta japonica]|uniref:Mos1 transposase HTH domain-containing protein n=1 Tax=Eumeta variegata TaxID=151549 RepID=A0A4C1T8C6_EUMVA|nr:Putative uncharacterized protein FLJ37770 [Eumeta japonica]